MPLKARNGDAQQNTSSLPATSFRQVPKTRTARSACPQEPLQPPPVPPSGQAGREKKNTAIGLQVNGIAPASMAEARFSSIARGATEEARGVLPFYEVADTAGVERMRPA